MHVCCCGQYLVMVQQVLPHVSGAFPLLGPCMPSLPLPYHLSLESPKDAWAQRGSPSAAPWGPLLEFWLGHKAETGPFFVKVPKIPKLQVLRTDHHVHSPPVFPRTWRRDPGVRTLCGPLPLQRPPHHIMLK